MPAAFSLSLFLRYWSAIAMYWVRASWYSPCWVYRSARRTSASGVVAPSLVSFLYMAMAFTTKPSEAYASPTFRKNSVALSLRPRRAYRSPMVLRTVRSFGSCFETFSYSAIAFCSLPCCTYFSAALRTFALLNVKPRAIVDGQSPRADTVVPDQRPKAAHDQRELR